MGKFGQLRKVFDGDDQFVSGGHQVVKSAGATRHATRVSKTPEWALSNEQVQALLLRSFPKLATDPKQRERAGRWMRIINLYYRAAWTQAQIAEEMGISLNLLKFLIVSIKRAANGEQANGKGKRGLRPRGRPRVDQF